MMSKEAKIGLLFSLIFIIAIAVILRNVHEGTVNPYMNVEPTVPTVNLSSTNQNELYGTTNQNNAIVREETPYTYPKNTQANDLSQNYSNQNRSNTNYNNESSYPQQAVNSNYASNTETRETRFSIDLPKSNNYSSYENNQSNSNNQNEYPFGMTSETYEQYLKIRNKLEEAQKQKDIAANVNITTNSAETKQVVHTVAEGETLTSIAMKYYGKKEGNRLVNIEKIFKANSDILSSINSVRIGQRLKIPAIDGVTTSTTNSNSVSNNPISIGQAKVYKVAENDSLWKIAERELGNGSRYQEIMDLNSNILKDANSLTVGMKLRLPAK